MAEITNQCGYCRKEFQGRSNQRYCTTKCKKRTEKARNDVIEITDRQRRYIYAEIEALQVGDYADVRAIRANRSRDIIALGVLLDFPAITADLNIQTKLEIMIAQMKAVINGYSLVVPLEQLQWGYGNNFTGKRTIRPESYTSSAYNEKYRPEE